MWSIGLKSRGRVGIGPIAGIELELVAASRRRRDQTAEVAVGLGVQRDGAAVVEHDIDRPRRGRPHPEMRPAVTQVFRADRITPRRRRVRGSAAWDPFEAGMSSPDPDRCCVPQESPSYCAGTCTNDAEIGAGRQLVRTARPAYPAHLPYAGPSVPLEDPGDLAAERTEQTFDSTGGALFERSAVNRAGLRRNGVAGLEVLAIDGTALDRLQIRHTAEVLGLKTRRARRNPTPAAGSRRAS